MRICTGLTTSIRGFAVKTTWKAAESAKLWIIRTSLMIVISKFCDIFWEDTHLCLYAALKLSYIHKVLKFPISPQHFARNARTQTPTSHDAIVSELVFKCRMKFDFEFCINFWISNPVTQAALFGSGFWSLGFMIAALSFQWIQFLFLGTRFAISSN